MAPPSSLERGRDAYERHAWGEAFAWLSEAAEVIPLEPPDIERLAIAAVMTGRDEEAEAETARAHQAHLDAGNVPRAAWCAFWLGMQLMNRGEMARAGGWWGRGRRLVDESGQDCAEQGLFLLPDGIQALHGGDVPVALEIFTRATAIGERFRDRDLLALSRMGRGRTLVALGRATEGFALLDEVMLAVTDGEVLPIVTGIVYCSVIECCQAMFDVRRAQEWTAALTRWCEAQEDLVPYRGQCLTYRAELLQLHGEWPQAMDEARRARELLVLPSEAAGALYQQGELHRLRGEFAEAEAAYRQASERGRRPEPGLALLRLAQGRIEDASAAIRRTLDEAPDPETRARLLPAHVEIMLAAGDVDAAEAGAAVLTAIAGDLDAPMFRAVAADAEGAVHLARGDARAALVALRRASSAWQSLEAPYPAARTRVLIAQACAALGDRDAADLERAAARRMFEQLGAATDLARLDGVPAAAGAERAGVLTAREVEVLRLIAAGKSNRAIAGDLVISEKTVARHVSNILAKLALPSRAAATAYAYEHDLVRAPTT